MRKCAHALTRSCTQSGECLPGSCPGGKARRHSLRPAHNGRRCTLGRKTPYLHPQRAPQCRQGRCRSNLHFRCMCLRSTFTYLRMHACAGTSGRLAGAEARAGICTRLALAGSLVGRRSTSIVAWSALVPLCLHKSSLTQASPCSTVPIQETHHARACYASSTAASCAALCPPIPNPPNPPPNPAHQQGIMRRCCRVGLTRQGWGSGQFHRGVLRLQRRDQHLRRTLLALLC